MLVDSMYYTIVLLYKKNRRGGTKQVDIARGHDYKYHGIETLSNIARNLLMISGFAPEHGEGRCLFCLFWIKCLIFWRAPGITESTCGRDA